MSTSNHQVARVSFTALAPAAKAASADSAAIRRPAAGSNTTDDPSLAAQPGGRGGLAGVGTNGGNGPAFGILHSGPAPVMLGSTKVTVGKGAAAVDARSYTDSLGNSRTIPATPAGVAAELEAL